MPTKSAPPLARLLPWANMAAMSQLVLRDLHSFTFALQQHPRLLVFKHSSACPISAEAQREYEEFCRDNPEVPAYLVDVLDDRPVARGIADHCGVKHQSPQAILFEQGKPVWHASHMAITRGSLEAAWGCKC